MTYALAAPRLIDVRAARRRRCWCLVARAGGVGRSAQSSGASHGCARPSRLRRSSGEARAGASSTLPTRRAIQPGLSTRRQARALTDRFKAVCGATAPMSIYDGGRATTRRRRCSPSAGMAGTGGRVSAGIPNCLLNLPAPQELQNRRMCSGRIPRTLSCRCTPPIRRRLMHQSYLFYEAAFTTGGSRALPARARRRSNRKRLGAQQRAEVVVTIGG